MATEPEQAEGAYELLTRPVSSWTDAQIETICADLRVKRARFIASGAADRPKAAAKPKATPEEKKQLTGDLLGDLLGGTKA